MPATKVKRSTARRSAKGTAKHNGSRTATRKRPVRPEDLTRFIGVSDPQISPDGDRVVFVRSHLDDKGKKRTSLWMAPAAGAAPSAFTNGESDSHPRWSPDGRTIAFAGKRDGAAAQLYVIPAGGGEARKLTSFPEGSIGGFRWSPDGRRLAVRFRETDPEWTEAAKKKRDENGHGEPPRVIDDWWYRLDGDGYFNAQRYRLHLVDADSGAHDLVYKGDTLGFFEFDFSPDGKHLAITTNRDKKALIRPWKAEILILDVASKKTRPVPGLPAGPKDAVRWSPDGKWLAYAGRVGEDDTYSTENLELFVCDPRRGKTRSLTGDTDYCLMAVASTDTAEIDFGAAIQWASDAKRVYMKLGWHGESHVASVPVKGGAVTLHTTGTYDHGMGNVSADGRRMALTRSSVGSLAEVYLGAFQRSRLEATALSALNAPLLRELKLAKAKTRWVQSEDGTPVQVWTMLPPDHKSGGTKKYPAVLEIHGGPHAMYGVGFFHEFQVLAAKGYAVFYSNPRGSKGYGRDHCAAIRGAWGTADWVDVQAVTALMKKHPNVRADRMGIMGGSYGGYMTNWAIGHTRDFAGAITDRCVSNVVTMGGTSDFVDEPDRYFPGNFWDRPEARWEQSPIKYIGNAKTPTLIIHSEGDLRCNIEQAEQVFVALKLLGVPTRLVRYPRTTSHGMSRMGPADLRIHRLNQILEWWGKYL
jgi:dipeptidyl aminopeptidase/acylaminoacyl peptidase